MISYAISDRKRDKNGDINRQLAKYSRLKADWVQIREKDLCDRELLRVARDAVETMGKSDIKVFVNGRADIALLAGAYGVHLPADSLPVRSLKAFFPALQIVKSCHSLEEVVAAENEGADSAVLSPIFSTPSKTNILEPLGLKVLEQACSRTKIPVIALGGILAGRIDDVLSAGAKGIAGLRLFNEWEDGEEENFGTTLRT
jgi:thiamine-phosphate pyrophosphorylase